MPLKDPRTWLKHVHVTNVSGVKPLSQAVLTSAKKCSATSTWWIGGFIPQPAPQKMKASRMFMEHEPLWSFSWGALNCQLWGGCRRLRKSKRGATFLGQCRKKKIKSRIYVCLLKITPCHQSSRKKRNRAGRNENMAKVLVKTQACSYNLNLWHKTYNVGINLIIKLNKSPLNVAFFRRRAHINPWNYSKQKVDFF